MRKLSIGFIIAATIVILGELTIIDYSNLSWSENRGSYLVIVGMIFTISALILSIRHEKNNKQNWQTITI